MFPPCQWKVRACSGLIGQGEGYVISIARLGWVPFLRPRILPDGCRSALAEAGYSEEEIEQELRIVVLQYAYVRQMQGKSQEALGIYQGILQTKYSSSDTEIYYEQRPTDSYFRDLDASIHAVAANNLVALRKNRELAESAKLLRAVGNSSMEQKLTSVQRRILAINGALLSLYMNKVCHLLLRLPSRLAL